MELGEFTQLFPPIIAWEAVEEMGSASKLKGMQHTLMYDKLEMKQGISQGKSFRFTQRLRQLIFFS